MRTIHLAIKAKVQDDRLTTLLLELGIDIDQRVDKRRFFQDRPLALAFEQSKYARAQALLNAGVLQAAKIKRPFFPGDNLITKNQGKILTAAVRIWPLFLKLKLVRF